jgi:hypothetical protein
MFKLILNKYTCLVFFFIAPSFCNSAALTGEEEACISRPPVSPKSLSPAERMERLKSTLADHRDMDMGTVVSELLDWWESDFQFVQYQVEQRVLKDSDPTNEVMLQRINLINGMVQKNTSHMSLAFLNLAWRLVANTLSGDPICKGKDERQHHDAKFKVTSDETEKLAEVLDEYKLMIKGPFNERFGNFSFLEVAQIYDHIRIQPGAFVITHISKQGLVSIPLINEGLAFQVNDRAYAVSFIGVGTNPALEYDGEHGKANGLWKHDHDHYRANFPWVKKHEGSGTINDALAFKEKIKKVYDKPEVQLALYVIFHEGNQWKSNDFAGNLKHCTANVQQERLLLPDFVKSTSLYDPTEQDNVDVTRNTTPVYLAAIKDAEWLKKDWPIKNGGAPFFDPNDEKNQAELNQLRSSNIDSERKRYEELTKLGTLGDQYLEFYLKGIQLLKQELSEQY